MRFEIGPGGMLLILVGLAGLSAAVFGLGLVAGHEMAAPEPGSQPAVAAYPLPPAAPASASSEPAEASAPPPASAAKAAPATASSETAAVEPAPPAVNPPPKPVVASAPRAKVPAGALVASRKAASTVASRGPRTNPAPAADEDLSTGAAVAPPSASAPAETADTGTDEGEDESAPAAAPAEQPRHKAAAVSPGTPRAASGPYSVQIDAMMDRAGAQQMAQKIRAKGFEPYIVPTLVDGKTWYRLRVGHYATPEQAQAAQAKLHQEFNDSPSGN